MLKLSKRMNYLINYLTPFKSQKKQDRWVIFKILPLKRSGFFVDLAAADGITHSNSYALEKLFNWSGICIEPNPGFYEVLKKERKCIVDNSVVNDKSEDVDFRIDNGQLGGIIAEDTDNNLRVRGENLPNANTISRRTVQLEAVLDLYKAPEVIDYLSLDVEGSEERVLRNFDFNKYIFLCITIERPTPKLNEILLNNGYLFVKVYQNDTFYIHSSLQKERKIQCDPFQQVPPKKW